MSVFAFSRRTGCAELLMQVDRVAPPEWPREARPTPWGSVAWAGDSVQAGDRWIVVGRPSADPWAWPGSDLVGDRLVERLADWGLRAVQSATGPFAVFDVATGSFLQADNGLIPFFGDAGDAGAAAVSGSTSPRVAQQLAGPRCVVRQQFADCAGLRRNRRTALQGTRVRVEMLEHRPPGPPAPGTEVLVPAAHDPMWKDTVEAVNRVRDLVETVAPRMWWEARLRGTWLFAPALERPVIDRLLEMAP